MMTSSYSDNVINYTMWLKAQRSRGPILNVLNKVQGFLEGYLSRRAEKSPLHPLSKTQKGFPGLF